MATLELPVRDAPDCLPHEMAPTGGHPECVLLIDDSEESMLLVQYALQQYGEGNYRLKWAQRLSEGLDQILKGGIDIVLLDLGLPESSGAESYAWVREIASNIPVVVLTGDAREETEAAVTASGVEYYLVKDQVSGALLLRTIRAALCAKRALVA